MQKEITTQTVQDKFKIIYEMFIDIICKNKDFRNNNKELCLLLNKINSNMSAVILLVSKAMFNESRIIFRSLFESVVLFAYLIEFPKEIEQYKLDDLIDEFHYLLCAYKRGYVPITHLIEPYNILIDKFENIIPYEEKSVNGIITYNIEKLEKYFRSEYKPLSQQTHKMIQHLLNSDYIHKENLYKFQLEFYSYYSQVTHNRLNTLCESVKSLTDEELLKQIQDIYKNCVIIYNIIFETLENKFNFQYPQKFYAKVREMSDYLAIKL